MIRWVRRLHIYKARQRAGLRSQRGQIATLMLLVIIVVLMFALMTANLGSVALASNNVTNAADASVLLLASQLASRSNQLYESLGYKTERFVPSGMLGPVLAIVFVLFVIFVPIGAAAISAATGEAIAAPTVASSIAGSIGATSATAAAATTIGVGAAAGAAGGAIGAGIAGTDPGVGAMQGAISGAAIGSAAVIGAELGAGSTGATHTATTTATTSSTASAVPEAVPVGEEGSLLMGPPASLAMDAPAAPEVIPPLLPAANAVPASTPQVVTNPGTGGADLATKVIQPPPPPPPQMPPPPPAMTAMQHQMANALSKLGPPPGGATPAQIGAQNVGANAAMHTFTDVMATTHDPLKAVIAAVDTYKSTLAAGLGAAKVGAAVGGSLSSASNLYSNSVKQIATADALAGAAKSISGLPDRQRIAYSVIFDALSRIVDDPTKVTDYLDDNGNGDHTDQISNFLYKWNRRTDGLLVAAAELSKTVAQFVAGPLKTMREQAQDAYSSSGPGVLARQEIEGAQGALEKLTSDLWSARAGQYQAELKPFWQPGPTNAEYQQWLNAPRPETCTVESCPTPSGWDEVDETIEHMKGFAKAAKNVQDAFVQDPRALTNNWDGWALLFYNPNTDQNPDEVNYDRIFGKIVYGDRQSFEGINGWMGRLERIRSALPQCMPDPMLPGVVFNPPCRDVNSGHATSDAIFATDEFKNAEDELKVLAGQLDRFRIDAKDFVDRMTGTADAMTKGTWLDLYGLAANALSFLPYVGNHTWKDSRGDHSVTVVVGPFQVPKLAMKTRGGAMTGETGIVMEHYHTTLNPFNSEGDSASVPWVVIIRQDPDQAKKPLGLWTWNNYDGQIVKFSSAHYSFDSVGLSPLNAIQPLVREILQLVKANK